MVQVNVISAEELVFANVAKIGSICETSKFSIHFFLLRLIHHKARIVIILTFLVFYLVNSRKVRTFVPVNGLERNKYNEPNYYLCYGDSYHCCWLPFYQVY